MKYHGISYRVSYPPWRGGDQQSDTLLGTNEANGSRRASATEEQRAGSERARIFRVNVIARKHRGGASAIIPPVARRSFQ